MMVSLSKLIADLPDTHDFLSWQLPIYTTFLLLEVMAAFFYFFTCNHLDEYHNYATILAVVGSLFAVLSDDLLAYYTLNSSWHISLLSLYSSSHFTSLISSFRNLESKPQPT
jgi:hypothetical protein